MFNKTVIVFLCQTCTSFGTAGKKICFKKKVELSIAIKKENITVLLSSSLNLLDFFISRSISPNGYFTMDLSNLYASYRNAICG